MLQFVSACALACSSFYFAKGWHFVYRFTVRFLLSCCLLGLHLTVCGLAKVAILPLNFHTKHTLQIYDKLSYEALNRHFCQTAVISCPSVCSWCCRVKGVGIHCCVVKIVGFIVQLQFYFQTSSNSNLSKLRLMSLPRLRQ